MTRSASWYFRRLRRMPPHEVVSRVRDRRRQLAWRRRQVRPGARRADDGHVAGLRPERTFDSPLPQAARDSVSPHARAALVAAADRLLEGEWHVLGWPRPDIADPDWFLDPVTGRRAPQCDYAFSIDHRDESVTGNVKAVWELSRHHHLTVLAAAWWLTGEERYAAVVSAQLRSWWAANPFLSGVHWTSGIEMGIRLVSWVWVRRLLDGWPGAPALFEENEAALRQIRWHQEHLAAFRSTGSSANNHLVAEACGRLVAACAFPWYAESDRWRAEATRELETSLTANTFPSGVNRELATDYHRFVTELALVAVAESDRAGHPLGRPTKRLLAASVDAAAALLDPAGRPARQGDADEGRALVLDGRDVDPWAALLDVGAAVFGSMQWWPPVGASVAGAALGALADRCEVPGRSKVSCATFADAGIYLMRASTPTGQPVLWCRCDGGPQGFLSIAAHGHADALSLEVRHGSVDVLADPGTYCYHGDPLWRSYFRSTRAHNTVEVDGLDQSVEGGPFLWSTTTDAVVERTDGFARRSFDTPQGQNPSLQVWVAHHTGYSRLDRALRHTRRVTLDPLTGELVVVDTITGSSRHTARLRWHLGPDVEVALRGSEAELSWPADDGRQRARLHLPAELGWMAHRGETHPISGWYSPRFGERVPSTTLEGSADWTGTLILRTDLRLTPSLREQEAVLTPSGTTRTPGGAELALGGTVTPRHRELP